MKITISLAHRFLLLITIFLCLNTHAQQWRMGAMLSYGLGNPYFGAEPFINEEGKRTQRSAVNYAYTFGGLVEFCGNDRWFTESGVLYAKERKLRSIKVGELLLASETFELDFIRVPLRAGYVFGQPGNKFRPVVYGGPSFSFLLNESRIRNDYRFGPDEVDPLYDIRLSSYKPFTTDLQFGLGCRYMLNVKSNVQLSAEYQTNRNERRAGIKNTSGTVNVAFTYK